MKISLNWLKSYIKLTQSPEEIGNILTDIGLEVEGIEEIESIPGGLEGLVIGEVLECVKHPNADKLKITKVDLGLEEPVQIVCGAPNVDKGQKVVVATVNTTIFPLNGESF
jgi:phenylalanyl-tRNA synthetase beta chain